MTFVYFVNENFGIIDNMYILRIKDAFKPQDRQSRAKDKNLLVHINYSWYSNVHY